MIPCDFVFLIMNCKKYKAKADLQKKTWLPFIENIPNMKYFHVIGDSNKCAGKKFCFDHNNKILYTNTKDDYNSLPSKVIASFQAIKETFEYKYVFKTDDDQHLKAEKHKFIHTMVSLLKTEKYYYGGYPVKVPTHISRYYRVHDELPRNVVLEECTYCNGRFYFLHKDALNNVLSKPIDIESRYIEDHMIGHYLDNQYKQKHVFLEIKSHTIFTDSEKEINATYKFQDISEIVIGSEGMGRWGDLILNILLKHLGYNSIIYKNTLDCNFVVSSHFFNDENKWNNKPKPYVYWSGESYTPKSNIHETMNLYILTVLEKSINAIYIPFFVFSNHLFKKRKYVNKKRPFLIAYCYTNKVHERERLFNAFVERTNTDICHSLGRCYGNYPQTNRRVPENWKSEKLIDSYKNYTFVLAMENKCKSGYVTEKIVNAFYSGSIPIYWGSSNINEFFNRDAFINVNDFNSFSECIDYVLSLNDVQIQEMTSVPFLKENNDIINMIKGENNDKNQTLHIYAEKLKNTISQSHINIHKITK